MSACGAESRCSRQRKLPAELNDDSIELFDGSSFFLWSLSEKYGFKVETKESPLSKVVVPMPQINAAIGAEESRAEFEARMVNVANLLVGNYNVADHNAYQGLQHV
jgi:hypothetical protein